MPVCELWVCASRRLYLSIAVKVSLEVGYFAAYTRTHKEGTRDKGQKAREAMCAYNSNVQGMP